MDMLSTLSQAMPGMPPESWWLVPGVLLLLGTLAAVDAVTGKIPDTIVLPGLLIFTALQGVYVDWPFAGRNLLTGLLAGFAIFLANEIWFRMTKKDAVGMGDAKWTVLAVDAFGVMPSVAAWVIGACVAILWMAGARVTKRRIKHVHFAPFLFIGILAGVWWFRLRTS